MKQHNFDNWTKEKIAHHEENAKPEWNKSQVFNDIIAIQKDESTPNKKWTFAIAAVILFLITLNTFQFIQSENLQDSHIMLGATISELNQKNVELRDQIVSSHNTIENYEANIQSISEQLENLNRKNQELNQLVEQRIIETKIEYITEYIFDTVYIETEILPELIAEDKSLDNEKMIEDDEFVYAYKPLVSSKKIKTNKIRLKIGSSNSKYGHKNNEPANLLSAEL